MENILESFVTTKKGVIQHPNDVNPTTSQEDNYDTIGDFGEHEQMTNVVLVLPLQCEWEHCNICFTCMNTYQLHVENHLNEMMLANKNSEDDSWLTCHWKECDSTTFDDYSVILRHIFYHTYHTQIKQIGNQVSIQRRLPVCKMDSDYRNVLPNLSEKLICKWNNCLEEFDNVLLYYSHVREHSHIKADKDGAFYCKWEGCETKMKTHCKIREHLKSHTQQKDVACPTCGSLFSTKPRFCDHVHRQNPNEFETFRCGHCTKLFASMVLLRAHMRHHVNKFKCEKCGMSVSSYSALMNHMKFRHSDVKPYKCSLCEHRGKTKNDIQRHLDTHSKNWDYCKFSNCKYRCRENNTLELHYDTKHKDGVKGKAYKCHMCTSSFSIGKMLSKHLVGVHNFVHFSGLKRFRYVKCSDGFFRLNTKRVDSLDLVTPSIPDDHIHKYSTLL